MTPTALQARPATPVCFVIKEWPIIFVAYSLACSGLPQSDMKGHITNGMDLPINHMHTALKPIAELPFSTTTGKNLCLYYKFVMPYKTRYGCRPCRDGIVILPTKIPGNVKSFLWRLRNYTLRCRNPIL